MSDIYIYLGAILAVLAWLTWVALFPAELPPDYEPASVFEPLSDREQVAAAGALLVCAVLLLWVLTEHKK